MFSKIKEYIQVTKLIKQVMADGSMIVKAQTAVQTTWICQCKEKVENLAIWTQAGAALASKNTLTKIWMTPIKENKVRFAWLSTTSTLSKRRGRLRSMTLATLKLVPRLRPTIAIKANFRGTSREISKFWAKQGSRPVSTIRTPWIPSKIWSA